MSKADVLLLENLELYKILLEKEKELASDKLSPKVRRIVEEVTPLLDRIPENMPEYTLHDPDHSAKVVKNMAKLIPPKVMSNLNALEITLLILSGYLHDIGMTCSAQEKIDIIKDDEEFQILFRADLNKFTRHKDYIQANDHRSATFIEDQIFTEYLRKKHITRSADFIRRKLSEGELILTYEGIPFYEHLISICDSHGVSVEKLRNEDKWPRYTLIGETIINVQYLSCVLRLADILDLDAERTPKVIYEFVNPKDPNSILEWKKHRSVIGYSISHDKILFEAKCTSPEVERALKEFMYIIEDERKLTIKLLTSKKDEVSEKYFMSLSDEIPIDRIKSNGEYIYNDLKFEIDYKRVIDLLMGQQLYRDISLAIRELLQNSFDAIKLRQEIYKKRAENFEPLIEVALENDILTITDNGIGMDEYIFKNYFLQVGKSYYSSAEYYSKFSDLEIVSQFGIGVLSTFMLAESIIVESRREPDNINEPCVPIKFRIPTAHSYTVQTLSSKNTIGTHIILYLKDKHTLKNSLLNIVQEIVPYSPYKIKITEDSISNYLEAKPCVDILSLPSDESGLKSFHKMVKEELSNGLGLEYRDDIEADFFRKIFTTTFLKTDIDTKGIDGVIHLINTPGYNFYAGYKGIFTQNHFTVGLPYRIDDNYKIRISENLHHLFPPWASFSGYLNLSNEACLTLTPDRTDVVVDKAFLKTKKCIETKILNDLEKFYVNIKSDDKDKVFDTLLTSPFIGLRRHRFEKDFFSDEAKILLRNMIHLPVLDDHGSIKCMPLSQITKYENIALTRYSLSNFTSDFIDYIKEHKVCIILFSKLYNAHFTHGLEWIFYILGVDERTIVYPKIIDTKFSPETELKFIKFKNEFSKSVDYYLADSIISSLDEQKSIIFSIGHSTTNPIFNISHPLINVLVNDNNLIKNDNAERLKNNLRNQISELLESYAVEILKTFDHSKSIEYMTRQINYYTVLGKLFTLHPDSYDKIVNLFNVYWMKCQDLNIVPKNISIPVISQKDFLKCLH